MSIFTQGRQSNYVYGKSTGPRSGDRYGHQSRNRGGSTNHRENTSRYEDISAGPPPWLNAYLENFKKKFITELTDNIVRTIDSSYRTSAELRKQRSNYFALKQRLAQLEAERNADKSQPDSIQQQIAHSAGNNDNKCEEKKIPEKFHSRTGEKYEDANKRFNETVSSCSNILSPKIINESSKDITEQSSTHEYMKNSVIDTIEITGITPSEFTAHFKNTQDSKPTESVDEAQDNMEPSIIQTNESTENSNPFVATDIEFSLEKIFNLLSETKSDEKILTTDELKKVDEKIDIDIISSSENVEGDEIFTVKNVEVDEIDAVEPRKLDKSLDEQNEITINKLMSKNVDSVIENIKKSEINTPGKQEQVVDIIFGRAIKDPNNAFIYAQLCKQFADIHKCTATFRSMLTTRFDIKLMIHNEKMKVLKIQERGKSNGEENVNEEEIQSNEVKSYEFMGVILFMGELYNQELLSDDIIEKYLQSLLQNDTEVELEYLCHILRFIGKNYELHDKSIAPYMNHLSELCATGRINENLTKLINSLIELMENNWQPLLRDDSSEATEFENAKHEE